MNSEFNNIVNAGLAPEGLDRINWAKRFMPALECIKEKVMKTGCLEGRRVGIILTLEPKTANLAIALNETGAEVSVFCSADYTTDSVAAGLESVGIKVFARSDADSEMDEILINRFFDEQIEFLVDDSAQGTRFIHQKRKNMLQYLSGVAEETTSGLRPIRVMEREGDLQVPCIAVNDAKAKQLFDNVYGTGQSVVATLLDLTNTQMQGKTVVVVGYGFVGSGIAKYAHALGARVVISEIDPIRALRAVYDGYTVAKLESMCPSGDFFITATGIGYSLISDHMRRMKDGAIVSIGGAGPPEIDLGGEVPLERGAFAREGVREIPIGDGKSIFLLADGHCSNVSAGEGNPIEIMDLSLAVQLSAVQFLSEHEGTLSNNVHAVSQEVDDLVAKARLEALGAELDQPSPKQLEHANSWKHNKYQ